MTLSPVDGNWVVYLGLCVGVVHGVVRVVVRGVVHRVVRGAVRRVVCGVVVSGYSAERESVFSTLPFRLS